VVGSRRFRGALKSLCKGRRPSRKSGFGRKEIHEGSGKSDVNRISGTGRIDPFQLRLFQITIVGFKLIPCCLSKRLTIRGILFPILASEFHVQKKTGVCFLVSITELPSIQHFQARRCAFIPYGGECVPNLGKKYAKYLSA
jgi:hypothetical protein